MDTEAHRPGHGHRIAADAPLEQLSASDYYELVLRLALTGGLSPAEASDVCAVAMLRLFDREPVAAELASGTREWLLATAVEQCAVAHRLWSWRQRQTAAGRGLGLAQV